MHEKWSAEEYDKAAQVVENNKGFAESEDECGDGMDIERSVDGSDGDSED